VNQTKATPLNAITVDRRFMKLQKNTGAWYTEEGQVIVAVYDPATGNAWFNDQSRGIAGYVKINDGETDPYTIWNAIFHAYNYHKYKNVNTYSDKGEKWVSWYDGEHREAKIDISTRL
jgi:streptogramin lyase